MKSLLVILAAFISGSVWASAPAGDVLVKFAPGAGQAGLVSLQSRMPVGTKVEDLGVAGWVHVKIPQQKVSPFALRSLRNLPGVIGVQPNHVISLFANWKVNDPTVKAKILAQIKAAGGLPGDEEPLPDNPPIPTTGSGGQGDDPLYHNQWGMNQMHVKESWTNTKGLRDMVVAVIDTGVMYTHEDLVDNIWHNPGEMGMDANGKDKSSNGVDDDGNGYVDDVIGWDFASNDNKPFDFTAPLLDQLFSGGNPGHGTHCAGNVGARSDNGKGIAGVAPNVQIMPLRFITEKAKARPPTP